MRENVVVVGMGQVGKAISKLCKEKYNVVEVDKETKVDKIDNLRFMHICIPFKEQKEFVKVVSNYIRKFRPELTIINSTVSPGTTRLIASETNSKVVHSPIRGQHDNLYNDIKRYTKYIGYEDLLFSQIASQHFENLGIKTRLVHGFENTELAKLLDTTQYAMLIATAQESERICKKYGVNYDFVREFGHETQRFYGLRPDIFPGVAGGHCLEPNVRILLSIFKSGLLKEFIKSNKKKKREQLGKL